MNQSQSSIEIQNREVVYFSGPKEELDLILNSGITISKSAKIKYTGENNE